ncbi:unnamed protein product [Staurois parvus]|uniref:Uncharacterized protein n=1 Tax=Staurois parvus TaxID=386267 RepID=A0ABN9FTG7_9NEOB|nr:unnamed protein product [Staurois parvus]
MGPLCPCPHSKKAYKRYQGHFMGPHTDPGPSGMISPRIWRASKQLFQALC